MKNIYRSLVALIFLITVGFYLSLDEKSSSAKEEYVNYITNHPYANRTKSYKQIEELPKKDRPDLAAEHNFLMIVDPVLKRIPSERLLNGYNDTKERLKILPKRKYSFIQEKRKDGSHSSKKSSHSKAIENVNWVERGPDNVGGRTLSLMWDPNDPDTKKVWAGNSSGGLWFNNDITDANSSWFNIDDFLSSLSISSLAYDPTNTDIFYAGTGEGFIATSGGGGVPGVGLYQSLDGGISWNLLSSTTGPDFRFIQKVIVTAAGTVLISTRESTNEGGSGGVFRSTNDGASWDRVITGRSGDMEIAANGDIYAARGIGSGSGLLFRSTDDGVNWEGITPPGGNPLRIQIAVAPSASSTTANTVLYAVAQDASDTREVTWFQRSDDGGETWTNLTIPEYREQSCVTAGRDFTRGQAFYNLILSVYPEDSDVVIMGGINVLKSSDGGVTMSEVSYWTGDDNNTTCDDFVHADQHEMVFRPGFPAEAIFGHDGGVSYSNNIGISSDPSFETRNNNYSVTQFYSVAADNISGSNYFLAGSQDNGTQRFSDGNGNSTTEATGGDGGFTHIDQGDRLYQITSFTGNTINHSSNGGITFPFLTGSNLDGLFINPTDLDNDSHILYSAGNPNELYRIKNINTTNPDDQEILELTLGQVSHINADANEPNRIFIGSRQAGVFRVDNADSETPDVVDISSNISATGNVSSISIGSSDDELLVTFSNYGVSSVWYSSNGGSSWVNKDDASHGLPDIPVRWSIFNPNNTSEVLLATELGVWSTDNISASNPEWEPTVNDLANVRCDMFQYREADDVLILATFGRGVYTSDVFSSTSDTTPPTAVSFKPTEGSGNNFFDPEIEIQFSEPIKRGTGNITIFRSSDDSTFDVIDVANTTTTGNTVLITAVTDFETSTEYYVNVEPGAFTDNALNSFAGIADNSTWSFTTFDGDFPPTVLLSIEDVSFVRNTETTVDIDLTQLFTDSDNDDATISKSVSNNTNPSLIGTTVDANTLTLSITPDLVGEAIITVQGNSNGKVVDDSFIVSIVDGALFSQLDNRIGSGIFSQQLSDRGDTIAQAADDFIVTDGEEWTISRVITQGFANDNVGNINEFRVEIYSDDNNAPADDEPIYMEIISAVFTPDGEETFLPVNVVLNPGKYWLSVMAVTGETTDWFWFRREPESDSEFYLNDREGLFDDFPVNTWVIGSDPALDIPGEDLIFSLEGTNEIITGAPSDIVITIESGFASLEWTDNSDNETSFSIEKSIDGGDYSVIGSTNPNVTTFSDPEETTTNTSYSYRIRALSTFNSAYGENSILTIPAIPIIKETNTVNLIEWEVTDGANSFEFDLSLDDFVSTVEGFDALQVNDLFIDLNGLEANPYKFRVRSANASGASESAEGSIDVITGLLSDNAVRELSVFPNPIQNKLSFVLPSTINGEYEVLIYDLSGNIVLRKKNEFVAGFETNIETSQLNSGSYFIVIRSLDTVASAQFVKFN